MNIVERTSRAVADRFYLMGLRHALGYIEIASEYDEDPAEIIRHHIKEIEKETEGAI